MAVLICLVMLCSGCSEVPQSDDGALHQKWLGSRALQTIAVGWSPTGALATARSGHTATLLPNGKVLVAGGEGASGSLASAEVYDLATGVWSPTGALVTARYYHTATLLPNGKVLVAGGEGASGSLASAEVYDPATGVWSPTGALATARHYHSATLLPNGKVLVAGGEGASSLLASAEVYDPAMRAWSLTGPLFTARSTPAMTQLPNGKVLLAGGWGTSGWLDSVEVYDPAINAWSLTDPLAMARNGHTATQLANGKVLVASGFSPNGDPARAELYDPTTGAWSPTGSLAIGRFWHTATLLPSGQVLVIGGEGSGVLTEVYDPDAEVWSTAGSLATARYRHTATLLPSGRVLVSGGIGPNGYLSSAEVYGLALVVTTPANGSTTNNNLPVYRGNVEVRSTVTVFVDDVVVGTTTADTPGKWSVAQTAALADGTHRVRARAIDAVDNVSADSDTHTFMVDTIPPDSPVITNPANSTLSNGRPTYSGMVEAGSIVIVFVNGAAEGAAMADASGNWSLEQRVALADGTNVVRARAMDAAGNTGADSNPNIFTVDATPPPSPLVTTPPNGSTTNNNRPVYRGSAEVGSTVTVFVDGVEIATTTAGTSGGWSVAQPAALADGRHKVRAQATDSVGNTSADLNTNTFTVSALVVTAPANGATIIEIRPIYSGRAKTGSTVIVLVDGMEVGTTAVDAMGMWNFTQPDALSFGHHTVRARTTDVVSNTDAESDTNTFTTMQRSHYGWSCATTPLLTATWALLALVLVLGRRHHAR